MLATQIFALGNRKLVAAEGGVQTEYTFGGISYRLHTFLNSGASPFTPTVGITTIDMLVVGAGGGGGGGYRAGGGGAGGLQWVAGVNVTLNTNYAIVVGTGGTGTLDVAGTTGGVSSFGTNIAHDAYGGGGGARYTDAPTTNSSSGIYASGGGGGGESVSTVNSGAVAGALSSDGTAFGFAGGDGVGIGGGGGGGSAGIGENGANSGGARVAGASCDGGIGDHDFIGTAAATLDFLWAAQAGTNSSNVAATGLGGTKPASLYIASGGGGGTYGDPSTPYSEAVPGGGGLGHYTATANYDVGHPALVNTGGGGGGSSGTESTGLGGTGGTGIVIIRYRI